MLCTKTIKTRFIVLLSDRYACDKSDYNENQFMLFFFYLLLHVVNNKLSMLHFSIENDNKLSPQKQGKVLFYNLHLNRKYLAKFVRLTAVLTL